MAHVKTIIFGRGSAAKRHTRILTEMGHTFTDEPKEAEYAVIASLTPNHARDLKILSEHGFKGTCLVEKPLFQGADEAFKPEFPVYVGYQLRHHPVIISLRKALGGVKALSVGVHSGQNISLWGGSYCGIKAQGGTVLREYSHELDLVNWLFGKGEFDTWISDNDDCYALAGHVEDIVISMQLNYVDMPPIRQFIVTTDKATFVADLINNTLNGIKIEFRPDQPTKSMHEAILSGGENVCTYEQGLEINRLIDWIEG